MNERYEESIWGENAFLIYDKLRSWGKMSHPVGALIPTSQLSEWTRLRDRLDSYGVKMNKGGFMVTIDWINTILDATCELAEKTGQNPIVMTDEIIKLFSDKIQHMEIDVFINSSCQQRRDILHEIQNQVSSLKTTTVMKQ